MTFAGDISTCAWVQIQPGSILDREVNGNKPLFCKNEVGFAEALSFLRRRTTQFTTAISKFSKAYSAPFILSLFLC